MNIHMLNVSIISKNGAFFQYGKSISAAFYKVIRAGGLKIGLSLSDFIKVCTKSVAHKLCRPFSGELK